MHAHVITDCLFVENLSNSYIATVISILIFCLNRFIEENPCYCVVDPFKNIYPLLDRLRIQNILVGLQEIKSCSGLRAPHFLRVSSLLMINGIIILFS
jgi:hypothetical protein